MSYSFDLVDQPWIPTIGLDGVRRDHSLRDVLLRAHELQEINGESPLETAALLRLLLAVLHRVFGPASADAWGALWEARQWDATALDAYLEQWRERMDLFHPEHPFLQAPDARVKPKPVLSLIHHLASGNNPTLFDHHTEDAGEELRSAAAARAVVTAQSYGLAGLSGLPQKFTDGTCARGVVFIVQGDSLFETLALNLVRYPDDRVMPHTADDRPAWEMDNPYSPERSKPLGYLDYLTWPNRRILLLPEASPDGPVVRQMTMAPALRLAPDVLDPMKLYTRSKKSGWQSLRFTEDRALWRDSAALFRIRGHEASSTDQFQVPAALGWIWELISDACVLDDEDAVHARRLLALGMANKQAKVKFYRSERIPIVPEFLDDAALVEELQGMLDRAEAVQSQLWGAGRVLARELLFPAAESKAAPGNRGASRTKETKPMRQALDKLMGAWAIERDYWSRLEIPFAQAVPGLPADPEAVQLGWRRTLLRTAWRAFERVAGGLENDARHLKAVVRARERLAYGLAKGWE